MALGTNGFTQADLAVMRPEIWSEKLNDFFKANLKAAKHFLNMSSDVATEGDVINIPNLTQMSATAKTNNAEITLKEMGAFA